MAPTGTDRRYPRIGDYAAIGDSSSVALVSRDGAIEWLCWPYFHSPSLFAAILDRDRGGTFAIRPVADHQVERRYRGPTPILETTFRTARGVIRLTDMMLAQGGTEAEQALCPDHQIARIVDCLEGEVEVEVLCDPRPDYARTNPPLDHRGELGFFYGFGSEVLVVRSEIPLEERRTGVLEGRAMLRAGDRCRLSLSYDVEEPAICPPLGTFLDEQCAWTEGYWLGWYSQCDYRGPHPEIVFRSALTLKLLSYSASGAMVAAPTSSLPEVPGGERNWDYRYCWLRDAVFTLKALVDLGYRREGAAFFDWLLYTIRRTEPEVNVLYNVFGRSHLTEKELDHLEGYGGARPVRIGNGAENQFQLDIYGELVSTAYEYVQRGGQLDGWQQRMLTGFGKVVCERWQKPDEGIWEVRSGQKRHTYSNVMCWVALDRLLELADQGHLKVPTDRFRETRDRIRQDVESHGYNEKLGSYVATFDGDQLDASLLLLPIYGYCDAGSDRMRSTYEVLRERLGDGPLMYRYAQDTDDGLSGKEGAFGICSFWAVEYLALADRLDEAEELFEKLLGYANDVGLYSEEIDPDSGELLGNFPQAFTHVGLINAALRMEAVRGRAPSAEKPLEDVKGGQSSVG